MRAILTRDMLSPARRTLVHRAAFVILFFALVAVAVSAADMGDARAFHSSDP